MGGRNGARVTVAMVDEIVAEPDPVLRNLLITVAYGRMAEDFAERVDAANLSWAAFGTWASEGVGGAIRHHQTDQSLVLRCLRRVMPRKYPVIAEVAADAFARGNRSVFDHIGRAFAGFHLAIDDEDPVTLRRFLARLPGVEEPAPEARVDLELDPPVGLSDGFGLYAEAAGELVPRRRAQLIAAANLCLAYVEQVRLQEPVDTAFTSLLPGRRVRHPLVRYAVARLFTEGVLKLRIGDETFRPGRRLWPRRAPLRPPDLEPLDPALFGRFGRVVSRWRWWGPDADDWRSLADRLRSIAALMASRQQATGLLRRRPFSEDQISLIDQGVVPADLRPSGRP